MEICCQVLKKNIVWLSKTGSFSCFANLTFHNCSGDWQGPRQVVFYLNNTKRKSVHPNCIPQLSTEACDLKPPALYLENLFVRWMSGDKFHLKRIIKSKILKQGGGGKEILYFCPFPSPMTAFFGCFPNISLHSRRRLLYTGRARGTVSSTPLLFSRFLPSP